MVYPVESLGSIHKAYIDRSRVGLVTYSTISFSVYMHKSFEWCDLKPNYYYSHYGTRRYDLLVCEAINRFKDYLPVMEPYRVSGSSEIL